MQKKNIQPQGKTRRRSIYRQDHTVGQKIKILQVRKQNKQTSTINLTDTLEDDKMERR